MLFAFYRIIRGVINKLRISKFRAEPTNSHTKFAGQEKLKIEPLILL